ncbi:hypothetical protein LCGC14_1853860 [marine sediment metagenome]|uniref:Uncharacterized protein n=1 Tax=marine sediment metagenome TaxID=412755 RepID=A0A0F9GXU1_9ZZZZ
MPDAERGRVSPPFLGLGPIPVEPGMAPLRYLRSAEAGIGTYLPRGAFSPRKSILGHPRNDLAPSGGSGAGI